MKILGIDPGKTGALAVIDTTTKEVAFLDMPTIAFKTLTFVDGSRVGDFIASTEPVRGFVEHVTSRTGQGVRSMFTFGMGFGGVVSSVLTMGVGLEYVSPMRWKRDLGLQGTQKHAALDLARLIYPKATNMLRRKKDIGRADALLIGHWGASLYAKKMPHESTLTPLLLV